jgi:hypothetical protein
MKKLFILSIACLTGTLSFAQHRLTSNHNMMRPGDEILKLQVEYKHHGRSGENVLWDFGKLTPVNDEYTLKYTRKRDSMIVGTEHRTMYRHKLSNDSLLLWGYENSTTLMKNKQPELLMKFPVSYKDKTFAFYHGKGVYCDRLELNALGTVETEADAYGMMVLPNKDTLKNVLRVRTIKKIAEETGPLHYGHASNDSLFVTADSINYRLSNDSAVFIVETYRWYERGYRYPIFETVRSCVQRLDSSDPDFLNTAFFYPPQEHYYLADDPDNLTELFGEENNNDSPNPKPGFNNSFTYNLYPNPVDQLLTVEYYLGEKCDTEIGIYDLRGIRLFDRKISAQSPGIHTLSIDMSGYARGNYILKL